MVIFFINSTIFLLTFLLILTSPLLEFFHMSPKDLWSNTDMFYRQIELAKQKEKRRMRQTMAMQKMREEYE